MAPVQSRPSRSSLGLGLAACGGVAATTLFVAPSAPPRTAPLDVPAVAATPSSGGPRPWAGFASEAGLALAAVGLATTRRGVAQSTALAATAVVAPESSEVEAPLPPPFNPASQVGAMEPLGFFDPMGFTKVGDEDGFRNLREAELKHGRVAMMASIGLLGQHYVKLPGFESAPAGFAALASGEGVLGFVLIFAASGILELAWRADPSREPGNFGDPFGVNMYTEEMRTKEISNGRMAMISVLGIFAAELASGKDAIQQFGLSAVGGGPTTRATASTFAGRSNRAQSSRRVARAAVAVAEVPEEAPLPPFNPAEQVGAMEPLGYFDPLGFAKVGDEDGFRNLREAELKHGRVAMMASIGLVGQHFVKFPFFENAPSGLAAMASGEGVLGFVLLFAVSGILELAWRTDPSREPGNFGDPFGVNMYTEEMRTKEISNGRMAMISVLGIFAAELATGKDAIQQFGL